VTYCVAVSVDDGLVFVSDSRTNAGVDNISTYSKMAAFGVPGERQFVICSAGNLATTQAVIAQIEKDIANNAPVNLYNVARMSDAAAYVGELSVAQQRKSTTEGNAFAASFLVGGEIANARCRVFLVYPEGNYIGTSAPTPFLQIGEVKYGKPILDRAITANSTLDEAAMCAILSMDATMRSNVTVGPPVELTVYKRGSLMPGRYVCFGEDSAYLRELRMSWNKTLRESVSKQPPIAWDESL